MSPPIFVSAADPVHVRCCASLRVGGALDAERHSPGGRLDSSKELEVPRPFGVAVPTGPGARRFSAPERQACWLFGAQGVAILRGRGAESFGRPSSPDALSGLRRSILRLCRLRVAVVGDRVVRSSSADSGFHSPQAGAFGSTSERAVAGSAPVNRGRTTRLDPPVSATEPVSRRRRPEPSPLIPSGSGGRDSGCRLGPRERSSCPVGLRVWEMRVEAQPVRAGE